MDAQTFLDNFGTIAQTPSGLERLRQLIIHLAVWGRLTGLEAGDSGQPEESHGHLTLLPSGWQELELGTFCGIYQPRTITKNDMVPGGEYPVYGANGQIGHFDEYNHAESEVTIGCRGTCGAVNVIPAFSWITGNAMVVKPDPEVLSKAALALVLRDIDYSEVISGTAQPQITRTNLAPTVVPIPPREEQDRIVAKVDELMALCDQLETQQQTHTQTATKLQASALNALTTAETADDLQTAWERIHTNWETLASESKGVDGLRGLVLELGVQGKLAQPIPTDEQVNVLLGRIEQEKRDLTEAGRIRKVKSLPELDESELGELPVGWKWARLQELSSDVADGTHKTPTYVNQGVHFVSIKDIRPWGLDLTDTKFITQEEHLQINERCNPEQGDVLFCRIGTLGRVIVVETEEPFSLFVSVGCIKPLGGLNPYYLRNVLNSPFAHRRYEQIKAGGSHASKLNLGTMRALAIPVPPLAEQHRIVVKVDELMGLCDELEARLVERDRLGEALAASVVDAFAA